MTGGLTGAEVAQKMMDDFNINDVRIVQGQGFLSDHYNPQTKTVSLSPEVYQGRNVAAAAGSGTRVWPRGAARRGVFVANVPQ